MKNNNRLAVVGLVLLLPATSVLLSGLSGFDVPPTLINPVAVMGGLVLALALNLWAILQVRFESEQNGAIAALTVRVATKAINLAVVAISGLLLATILGYLFVENFRLR